MLFGNKSNSSYSGGHFTANFKRHLRWFYLSILVGILAGLTSAFFLITLKLATTTREQFPFVILALPAGGFFIGWIYHRYGKEANGGTHLILDEIHDPRKIIPLRMAPLVWLGTILTHLFGGSAGREGTAVQMGATLSDQLSKYFKVSSEERKILLVAGAGAGFGAAIGTPWAGMIFGMEVVYVGRLRPFALFECFVASFVAYGVSVFLRAPHSQFPKLPYVGFDLKTFFFVVLAGILFGLAARLFVICVHFVEYLSAKLTSYPPIRPLIFGFIIAILFYIEGSYRFAGLGISVIQESLRSAASYWDPVGKTFFTALTVGSGFKGGEFIPLVYVGTTLGSALSTIIPVSFNLLGSLGFAAVFAGAANTPIACSLMAIELFGLQIAPYAVVACLMSYACSGPKGIYKSQKKYISRSL